MYPRKIFYGTATFLGSLLLFLIEPIAGKRLLPLLGGSAAVWATCLVFFQTTLLLGYLCAHWLVTRVRPRTHAFIYMALLLLALAQAAFHVHPQLRASTLHPIVSVFILLAALIGLPFLVLSATSPLLQFWYSRASVKAAVSDAGGLSAIDAMLPPYRLFALSNLGSLLALVLYPWLLEPRYSLGGQSMAWLVGFIVFGIACAAIVSMMASANQLSVEPTVAQMRWPTRAAGKARTSSFDCILWLLLPACGSVLLCALTNHLSQDVAPIPLLWVVPLIAYLLSFVWAFSGERFYSRKIMFAFVAVALGVLACMLYYDDHITAPIWFIVLLYCVGLFLLCLACHGELYRLRPAPQYATSFYVLIAAGGALGAVLVGVVAPLVLRANYELACGLVLTALLLLAVSRRSAVPVRLFWTAVTAVIVALLFVQVRQNERNALDQVRNFYGALRVTEDPATATTAYTRNLYHGTILHGTQVFNDRLRKTPTTYYGHDSGVGLALDHCCGERPRRVGVIGLGTGTLAAYGRKGDVFRFYDINPLIVRIAQSRFTYLRESKAASEIVLGDARLSLAAEPPQRYDILVIDAFSGDAIPVHLLTREAVELYQRHLRPGGILAVHVSNQYLNLPPVVQKEADQAGLMSLLVVSEEHEAIGVFSSDWVLATRNNDFLRTQEVAKAGKSIDRVPGLRLWTDDYSSLLPLLKPQKFSWSEEGD
jgi:spermidine synthase